MIRLKQKICEKSYRKYLIKYRSVYCERYGIGKKDFDAEKRRLKMANHEAKE